VLFAVVTHTIIEREAQAMKKVLVIFIVAFALALVAGPGYDDGSAFSDIL
jgi:hypothetical protein